MEPRALGAQIASLDESVQAVLVTFSTVIVYRLGLDDGDGLMQRALEAAAKRREIWWWTQSVPPAKRSGGSGD